jgi:glycosyltransferase involved in cell wall biosynthesis
MAAKPRILFVCPNLGIAGAERQWSMLIPALRDRGFVPRVLTLDDTGAFYEQLQANGIDMSCAGIRNRYDIGGIIRALREGRRFRPDVVFIRSVSGLGVGRLIGLLARAPVVANERTDYALRPLRPHQLALMRALTPSTHAAIAVSPAQSTSLPSVGFRRDRIHVIPNGTPDPSPRVAREQVREELGIQPGEFLAVLVAALRPEKRALDFVAAVAKAHRRDPLIRGLVVGGGPQVDAVRAAADEADGSVRVLGFRLDAIELMHASDVVCLTSVHEAASNVILEAMALSRPVITTAIRGNSELVADGETGILVPPSDVAAFARALSELALDRERARALGRAGRERQQTLFAFDRMVDAYDELLTGIAGRGR